MPIQVDINLVRPKYKKTIHRTYRYALLPNKVQQTLLDKHFGCVRYIYNYFLDQHKEQYESLGKPDNYYAQARSLVALKKQEETIWLKEVNSQTLQFALRCLNTAFTNFFSAKAEEVQKEKKQLYCPSICARGRRQVAFSKIQFRDKNQPASKPSGRNQAMYP